ncbi:hypothetical protein PSENEW3_00004814 [Picochlorum sp. SENEW3]|nr:hypothetical protein PSENEW3_00004814 [Picochlorum sp. SENEW3]
MKIKAFFPRADAGTSRSEHRNDENRDPSSTSHVPTIQEEKEDSPRKRLRSSVPTDDVLLDKNINSNVPVVQELSPNSRTDDVNSPLVNASGCSQQEGSYATVCPYIPDEEDGRVICKTDSLIGSKRDRWQQYSDQIRKNSNKKQPIKNLDRFPVSPSVAAHDDSESESPENRLCVFSKAYYEARVEEISRYRDYVMMKVEAPIEECLDNVRGVLRDRPAISSSDVYQILDENADMQTKYADGHQIFEYCRESPQETQFRETAVPNEFSTAEMLLVLLLKEFECMITGERKNDLKKAIDAGPIELRRYFEQFMKGNWRLLRMDRAEQAFNRSMADHLEKKLADNLETSTFVEYNDEDSRICMVCRLETVLAPLLSSSQIHWTTDELRLSLWSSHVCCWIRNDHGTSLEVVEDFFCGVTRESVATQLDGSNPQLFTMASGRMLIGSRRARFVNRIPSSDSQVACGRLLSTEDEECYSIRIDIHKVVMMVKHEMTSTELRRLWADDRISVDHITRDMRCNDIFSLRFANSSEQARNQTRFSSLSSRFVPSCELSNKTSRDSIEQDIGNNHDDWITCKERSVKYSIDDLSKACQNGKILTTPLVPIEGLSYNPNLKCLRKMCSNGEYGYWDISNVKDLCFSGNGRTFRYPSHQGTKLHKLVGDTMSGQSEAPYVQYDEEANEYNIIVHDHVQCPFDPNFVEEVTMRENAIRGNGVETMVSVLNKPDSDTFESIKGRTRQEAARLVKDHFSKDEFKKDATACRIKVLSIDTLVSMFSPGVGKVTDMYSNHIRLSDKVQHTNNFRSRLVYKVHYCSGEGGICLGFDKLAHTVETFWSAGSLIEDLHILGALVDQPSLRQSLCMFLSNGNIRDITYAFVPMTSYRSSNRMRISMKGEHVKDVTGWRGLINALVDIYHGSSGQIALQELAEVLHNLIRCEVRRWPRTDFKPIYYGDVVIERIFDFERHNAKGVRETIECVGPENLLRKVQEYIHPDITSIAMLKHLITGSGIDGAQERWYECRAAVKGITSVDPTKWLKNFDKYKKELEDADGVYPNLQSPRFGQWISAQRTAKKQNDLSDERIDLLETLPGWQWAAPLPDDVWRENFDKYKKELEDADGVYPVLSPSNPLSQGFGRWIGTQRTAKKQNSLSAERIYLLETLPGWKWEGPLNEISLRWRENFDKYKKELEDADGVYPSTDSKGFGQWISDQRKDKRKNKLIDEKVRLLETLPGWRWEGPVAGDVWRQNFDRYKKELEDADGVYPNLHSLGFGKWINAQRVAKNKNELSAERIDLLETLSGWKWEGPLNEASPGWLEKFHKYKKELEDAKGVYPSTKSKGFGTWIANQRTYKRTNNLSALKVRLLETLPGWKWAAPLPDDVWRENFDKYKKELEDADGVYPSTDSKGFGQWISAQRTAKKQKNLSAERIDLLETLPGWKWEDHLSDDVWREKFHKYKKELEDADGVYPPLHSSNPLSQGFGRWIDIQRKAKKKKSLSAERIDLLETLPGWKWEGHLNEISLRWRENFDKYKKELDDADGVYPSTDSKGFGQWISDQRKDKRKNKLIDEKVRLLETLPGWKWAAPLKSKEKMPQQS